MKNNKRTPKAIENQSGEKLSKYNWLDKQTQFHDESVNIRNARHIFDIYKNTMHPKNTLCTFHDKWFIDYTFSMFLNMLFPLYKGLVFQKEKYCYRKETEKMINHDMTSTVSVDKLLNIKSKVCYLQMA